VSAARRRLVALAPRARYDGGVIDRPAADDDLPLSALRLVEWDLEATTPQGPTPSTSRELVPVTEVPILVEALLKLHHSPGVNPHSGRPTARLVRVRVGKASLGDGYWWTGPTLQDEGLKARLVRWTSEVIWDAGLTGDEPQDPV
jgi:hypothetical protein